MIYRTLVSCAALASCLLATPAVAQQEGASRTFTMDGNWALDAGEDYCRLAANFTDGQESVGFALERNRAENFARLILVGNTLRPYRGADELGYSYLPDGAERSARFLRSETADKRGYFNFGAIAFGPDPFAQGNGADRGGPAGPMPPAEGAEAMVIPPYDRAAELDFAAGVHGIEVSSGLREPIRIETGSMRAPIEALQACADDLLRVWGLDYEQHQTMTRRAAPVGPAHDWLPGSLIGFQDFSLLGGGNNVVRVMVDAAGQPTDCAVHWASLDARKNERMCSAILENGAFEPALDADGQPMASYWMVDPIFGLVRPFGS